MGVYGIFEDEKRIKSLTRVVAHLMGDGGVSGNYLRYNNKNITLLENFKLYFTTAFGETHFILGKSNSGTSFVQVQNKEIISFLKSLAEDYRSFSICIPTFVNNLNLKREFLSAIYDDEGSAPLRVFKKTNEIKRNVNLSSNSLKLINQIRDVLEKDFDIKTNKIAKNVRIRDSKVFTNYILNITGKSNLEKFRDRIGFSHPDKINKLNLMLNSYKRLASTI